MSMHFLPRTHASEAGGLLVDGLRDETDAGAFRIVEQDIEIKTAMTFKKGREIERLSGRWIKTDGSCLVAVDEIRPSVAVPLNLRTGDIAPVPQNKVAFAKLEIRGRCEVVPRIGIYGEIEQSGTDEIKDRLDPRVADA